MIKKFCLAFVCLAIGVAVSAQTTEARPDVEETVEYEANPHRVITNTFWSNWFISVGGGVQAYVGGSDGAVKFGQRIVPAFDLSAGKWFTPVVGARLTYSGFNGKTPDGITRGELHKFPIHHLHADFMLNLNTLFAGYKEGRVWNCVPYIGVGAAFSKKDKEPTVTTGLLNAFSVCKRLDINIDIHTTLVQDGFNGIKAGRNWEGLGAATVGLTYKLGKADWDRPKTVTRTNHAEANALLKKLNAANAENADLKKALTDAEAKANAAPKEVAKPVAADDIVLFNIGEAKLTKAAQVSLGSFAGMIKDLDPNTVYVITGYADAATGSKARNEKLSKARAEAAYDCLVNKYGVNPEQLKVDYKGGVDNMFFDDPSLSRAVIISIQ